MPRVDLELAVDVARSPRVAQVEGMFDVPSEKRRGVSFHFDVPLDERPWQIGLIVGPSGAGKSSVARALFGEALVEKYEWAPRASLVDGFGDLPIREIVEALSSVGFASPPSWTKPYAVLSNGEKFRADLARALTDPRPLVAVDEFTSVVDRTVGRIGASAVSKAVRRRPGKRFVAVTCHDDVTDWLQPDWVLEPHVGRFVWRSPQRRPLIVAELVRATHETWDWFAPYHYLSRDLARAAQCFVALVEGRPAAFASVLHFPHASAANIKRVSRIVVLPDYQGAGLARGVLDALGGMARDAGQRLLLTTSHPALVASLARSDTWRLTAAPQLSNPLSRSSGRASLSATLATRRRVATLTYVGPPSSGGRTMWSATTNMPGIPRTRTGATLRGSARIQAKRPSAVTPPLAVTSPA